MQTMTHGFGWVRDLPDPRDFRFATPPEIAKALPPSVDLRPQMPPVYDQGQLGSCTGNAWAAAFDYERGRQGLPFMGPSRLFIYYNERDIEGNIQSDSGASIRSGVKSLADKGVCPESVWPYDVARFRDRPTDAAYVQAQDAQALEYYRVTQTEQELMGALAAGYCVVYGFLVYRQFENLGADGIVRLPNLLDQPVGGHAGCLVGYYRGNNTLYFIDHNSWGTGHGDRGHAYFPSSYLTNSQLADDFWALKLVEGDPAPPPPPPDPTPSPYYVGDGIRALMAQYGDVPLNRENYAVNELGQNVGWSNVYATNPTTGKLARYTWLIDAKQVIREAL